MTAVARFAPPVVVVASSSRMQAVQSTGECSTSLGLLHALEERAIADAADAVAPQLLPGVASISNENDPEQVTSGSECV